MPVTWLRIHGVGDPSSLIRRRLHNVNYMKCRLHGVCYQGTRCRLQGVEYQVLGLGYTASVTRRWYTVGICCMVSVTQCRLDSVGLTALVIRSWSHDVGSTAVLQRQLHGQVSFTASIFGVGYTVSDPRLWIIGITDIWRRIDGAGYTVTATRHRLHGVGYTVSVAWHWLRGVVYTSSVPRLSLIHI